MTKMFRAMDALSTRCSSIKLRRPLFIFYTLLAIFTFANWEEIQSWYQNSSSLSWDVEIKSSSNTTEQIIATHNSTATPDSSDNEDDESNLETNDVASVDDGAKLEDADDEEEIVPEISTTAFCDSCNYENNTSCSDRVDYLLQNLPYANPNMAVAKQNLMKVDHCIKPCTFCEQGVMDPNVIVPNTDGHTCDEIQTMALSAHRQDMYDTNGATLLCMTLQKEQGVCCPRSNSTVNDDDDPSKKDAENIPDVANTKDEGKATTAIAVQNVTSTFCDTCDYQDGMSCSGRVDYLLLNLPYANPTKEVAQQNLMKAGSCINNPCTSCKRNSTVDRNNSTESNAQGGNNSHVNIPATMGYYNLSCPFEWYKYSCATLQRNEFDKQVTAASTHYYEQHLSEVWRAFDSVFNVDMNKTLPHPKRIFMTGDSLLRQVFISVACNAFSLNAVEQSEVRWGESWPCPAGLRPCKISRGQHSGFNVASVRFKNGIEIHFVTHSGAAGDTSQAEPDVLQRMKTQIDTLGNIDFGNKTAFPPSGPIDILVYNIGRHQNPRRSEIKLNSFASEIAMPLMKKKNDSRPKIVYVTTPTAHFDTIDGEYDPKAMRSKKCVERVPRNPRAELEKQILKAGVNVDVLLDFDDLELGAFHVHKGDCAHYCMPGVVDLVAARLLESF